MSTLPLRGTGAVPHKQRRVILPTEPRSGTVATQLAPEARQRVAWGKRLCAQPLDQIQREKKLREDNGLLVEAQGQYEDYAKRYAWQTNPPEWLADAYFNLALIFLQRGDNKRAEEFLGKMYGAAPYDRTTHIYQVIWSPNTKDVIDSSFDSKQLAEYANSLIYAYAYGHHQQVQKEQGPPFETIVEKIRLWCKGKLSAK